MRLIDADELKKMFMYAEDAECSKWSLNGVISEIDDMPTVCDIEQIRAEIADLDDADYDYEGYYKAVTDAVNIIDKYTKGE